MKTHKEQRIGFSVRVGVILDGNANGWSRRRRRKSSVSFSCNGAAAIRRSGRFIGAISSRKP